MNAIIALVRRETRDAAFALAVAASTSAIVLVAIHALLPRPYAVSQGAASAAAILITLWTLYFAADSFASDFASGRVATDASLPIGPSMLCAGKLVFVTAALGALASWIVGCEYALQMCAGSAESAADFGHALANSLTHLPLLALLAALAVTCSLVAGNSLAAMLLALMGAGALWTLATPLARELGLVGISGGAHVRSAASIGAAALVAIGALAFVRGQRRMGNRDARVATVLVGLLVLSTVAGSAVATTILRRRVTELDDRDVRIHCLSASPDGRWIALEVARDLPVEGVHCALWLLDSATGRRALLARPGMILRDAYADHLLPWDSAGSLRFLRCDDEANVMRADLSGVESRLDSLGAHEWGESRIVPAWAEATSSGRADARVTQVRWKERGLVWTTSGNWLATMIGRAVLPTPTPGAVLVCRDGRLERHELGGESRVLLACGVERMSPSSDGRAVLVLCADEWHALSSDDGTPLHDPWPRREWCPRWIDGSSARVVSLRRIGVAGPEHVLDLDRGRGFEISCDRGISCVIRAGELGYVFADASGDLVRVDLDGAHRSVLLDRD